MSASNGSSGDYAEAEHYRSTGNQGEHNPTQDFGFVPIKRPEEHESLVAGLIHLLL